MARIKWNKPPRNIGIKSRENKIGSAGFIFPFSLCNKKSSVHNFIHVMNTRYGAGDGLEPARGCHQNLMVI